MKRRRLSRRARLLWAIGSAAAVAAVVVGALVFQPWLLFIDVRVDDDIPAAVAATQTADPARTPAADPSSTPVAGPSVEAAEDVTADPPPPAPVDLARGTFVSHEHDTSGTVRVIEHPDGTRQLAIEGLQTTNGPDVHVWLSAGPVIEGFDGWFTAAGYDHIDLGPIKGNLGNQLYDIPDDVDLGGFPTVDLWCVQFSVSFGAAALV